MEYIDEYITTLKNNNVETVSKQISVNATKAIVAVALFIAIRIVLIVFYKLSEMLAELPIIKQFNKAGGVIYGLIEGLVIVYVALYIAVLIGTISNNLDLITLINNSMIGRIVLKIM